MNVRAIGNGGEVTLGPIVRGTKNLMKQKLNKAGRLRMRANNAGEAATHELPQLFSYFQHRIWGVTFHV